LHYVEEKWEKVNVAGMADELLLTRSIDVPVIIDLACFVPKLFIEVSFDRVH